MQKKFLTKINTYARTVEQLNQKWKIPQDEPSQPSHTSLTKKVEKIILRSMFTFEVIQFQIIK
jgi:hypothetical protein